MIDERVDLHTHSDLTDGADPLTAMVAAARALNLETIGLSDHVRAATAWVPEYVTAVRALEGRETKVACGLETKILDQHGRLDLPTHLPELDYLLVADHQYPGSDGPVHPAVVKSEVAAGQLGPGTVISRLVTATAAAISRSPAPAVVAHLFSLLPKCGIQESEVTDSQLDELAQACRSFDARVEVNEKWRCPSPRVIAYLHQHGVVITAGSDAHRASDVGRWNYVRQIVKAV